MLQKYLFFTRLWWNITRLETSRVIFMLYFSAAPGLGWALESESLPDSSRCLHVRLKLQPSLNSCGLKGSRHFVWLGLAEGNNIFIYREGDFLKNLDIAVSLCFKTTLHKLLSLVMRTMSLHLSLTTAGPHCVCDFMWPTACEKLSNFIFFLISLFPPFLSLTFSANKISFKFYQKKYQPIWDNCTWKKIKSPD